MQLRCRPHTGAGTDVSTASLVLSRIRLSDRLQPFLPWLQQGCGVSAPFTAAASQVMSCHCAASKGRLLVEMGLPV